MAQVRYDVVEIRKPERTAQGFLRADAILTRSGVFVYRNPDGSTRREYRPPDEVFRDDSLESFVDAPITIGHPDRLVTKETANGVMVGIVRETPRRSGGFAVARVLVTDAKAIEQVESKKRESVSCGYTCDFDATPGVTPDGERYDGIQRNIQGNHLALVPAGRAGPEARIRLDADDAVMVIDQAEASSRPNKTQEKAAMAKVRLDGVDYDASEQLAQAITVATDKQQKRIDELEAEAKKQASEMEKQVARADAAADEAKKAKERADEAEQPEKMREAVRARVELERQAVAVLGPEVKLDGMDDQAIKAEVVEKLYPGAKTKMEKASSEYVQARFDAAIEAFVERPNGELGELRAAAGSPETREDSVKAREKFYADEASAWKNQPAK